MDEGGEFEREAKKRKRPEARAKGWPTERGVGEQIARLSTGIRRGSGYFQFWGIFSHGNPEKG